MSFNREILIEYIKDTKNPNLHRLLSSFLHKVDSGKIVTEIDLMTIPEVNGCNVNLYEGSLLNGILLIDGVIIGEYAVFDSIPEKINEIKNVLFSIKEKTYGVRCIYGEVTGSIKNHIISQRDLDNKKKIIIFESTPPTFGSYGYVTKRVNFHNLTSISAQLLNIYNLITQKGCDIPMDSIASSIITEASKSVSYFNTYINTYGYEPFISSTHSIKFESIDQIKAHRYLILQMYMSPVGKLLTKYEDDLNIQLESPRNKILIMDPELETAGEVKTRHTSLKIMESKLFGIEIFTKEDSDLHLELFKMNDLKNLKMYGDFNNIFNSLKEYLKWEYNNDGVWYKNRNREIDMYIKNSKLEDTRPELPSIHTIDALLENYKREIFDIIDIEVDNGCNVTYNRIIDSDVGNLNVTIALTVDILKIAYDNSNQKPVKYANFDLISVSDTPIHSRFYEIRTSEGVKFMDPNDIKETYGIEPITHIASSGYDLYYDGDELKLKVGKNFNVKVNVQNVSTIKACELDTQINDYGKAISVLTLSKYIVSNLE